MSPEINVKYNNSILLSILAVIGSFALIIILPFSLQLLYCIKINNKHTNHK